MILMKALKGHTFGGKYRNPGDTYEARERLAKTMIALGRAEFATEEEKPKRKKRTYKRKDMQAESE